MVMSGADNTKRENMPLASGRAVSTTSCAGSSVRSEVKVEGLSARVLMMLRLPLTAFRMVPISSLLHCVPGKQADLPSTSPDRYERLFLNHVRLLKKNGKKTLTRQAWYLWRAS